ncbi:MAG: hypothetical protein ACRDUA_10000 [Micromonosporaceae bacterium]
MRHVWSGLAGLVLAPVAWALLGAGSRQHWREVAELANIDPTVPWVAPALLAGLLLGLVGTLRISPVGPLVIGALYVAAQVVTVAAPKVMSGLLRDLVGLLPPVDAPAAQLLARPLASGTLGFAGALLIVAVFSAKRWRRWPAATDGPAATDDEDQPDASTAEETPEAEPTKAERDLVGVSAGQPDTPGDNTER